MNEHRTGVESAAKVGKDRESGSIGPRIVTVLIGIGLLVLAYYMFTHPTVMEGEQSSSGRARNQIGAVVIQWLWSRPVAVLLGLLGLLVTLGGAVGGGRTDKGGHAERKNAAPDSAFLEIDSLLESMRRGEPGAEPAYWRALFALPEWHFYSSKSPARIAAENDTSPPLFIGVVDGRPMLHVFTSEARAYAFGVARAAGAEGTRGEGGIAVLSMPPEAAIKYVLRLPPDVEAVLIDEKFFGIRENLTGLYAVSRGLSVAEGAKLLGVG